MPNLEFLTIVTPAETAVCISTYREDCFAFCKAKTLTEPVAKEPIVTIVHDWHGWRGFPLRSQTLETASNSDSSSKLYHIKKTYSSHVSNSDSSSKLQGLMPHSENKTCNEYMPSAATVAKHFIQWTQANSDSLLMLQRNFSPSLNTSHGLTCSCELFARAVSYRLPSLLNMIFSKAMVRFSWRR